MDTYALHLAMAALVGASFVAVSAYYVHRKTLTQLLEFARAVERERDHDRDRHVDDEDDRKRSVRKRTPNQYRRKGGGHYRVGSVSLPDVMAAAVEGEEEAEEVERVAANGQFGDLGIPPGLPRLHTVIEGNYILDRFLSELLIE